MIDFLVEHEFGVMFSLDGPKHINDINRLFPNGQSSFDLVFMNAKKLLNAQLKAGVTPLKLRSTLSNYSADIDFQVKDFFEKEFPGARMMIGESGGMANYSFDFESKYSEESSEKWDEIFYSSCINNPISKIDNDFLTSLSGLKESLSRTNLDNLPGVCGICRNMLALSADGIYYPCHRFVGLDKFDIGNLSSGLNYDKISKVYKNLILCYDFCKKCWIRNYCEGGCPAYLANGDGTFGPPNPKWCEGLRKSYERAIVSFYAIQQNRPELLGQESNEKEFS